MAYKANHNNTIDSLYEDHRKAPPTPPSPPATLGRQIASPSHLNSNASSSIGNANHATATAPIPEDDSGIPWGDRKPAAKTFTFSDYEYEADYDSNEFECEADYDSNEFECEAEYEYKYKYKYEYQMEDIDTDDDDPLMDPKRFRNNGVVTDNTISPDVESGIIVASDPVVRQALVVGKKDGVLFPRTSFSSPQRSRSFRRSDSSLSPIITSDPPGDATSTTLHGTIQTTTTSTSTTTTSTTTSTTSSTNTNTNTNTTAKEEAAATPKLLLLQDEQDNDDSSTLLIDSAKQLFPPPRFHDTSTSSTYYKKKKKNTGIITKRELLWAVLIFFAIVGIAVGATTAVLFVGDRQGIGAASSSSSDMVGLPPTTTTLAPIPGDHSDPSSNPPKLTVREEWELVCAAIRSSPATRSLLVVGNGNGNSNNNNNNNNNEDDTLLSDDPSVYRELVQGMVFSEQHRDWIPSAFGPGSDDDQDDLINLHGMMTATGALATATANANANATATATATANNANQNYGSNLLERPPPLTPHQKATAWLLYYDTRKDPNESVWRWALAALYFRMGGPGWTIFSSADDDVEDDYNEYGYGHASSSSKATTPRWFTSAPICDWERLEGCQALQSRPQYHQYDLHKHQQHQQHQQHNQKHKQPPPRLPVDLDFDDANLSGSIPPEFALLKLYYYPAAPNGTNNETDTDTDTDTGLSSDSSSSSMASSSMASSTVVRTITLTDNQLTGKIPGPVFAELAPSLGKLYLDGNQLMGSIPIELGGLDALYVQNNALTGDWPEEFCADNGNDNGTVTDSAIDNNIGNPIHAKSTVVDDYGLDCDQVECSCCGIMQCYY